MNQAEILGSVVVALGTLVGLYYTVCRPMIDNQKTMTELTCAMRELSSKLVSLETHNTESHRRIFQEMDECSERIQDHETRIHDLEVMK